MKKQIMFKVSGVLFFSMDESIDVQDYLDKLRDIGAAKIDDVQLVNFSETGNIMNEFEDK